MGAFQEYMDQLDSKIENYKSKKGETSYIEILRLIYIDLGQKMNFDLHYIFGNKRVKNLIYNTHPTEEALDLAMKNREIICKSLAYIVRRIVSRYGIKCDVYYEEDEHGRIRPCAHVYNTITTPDGKKFIIDLEEDLEYIKTGAKTKYFAVIDHDKPVSIFSEDEIRDIDKKIGYIPEGIYMDDILWMMDKAVSNGISDDELFEFVLDNLNKYRDIRDIGYRDRMLYYERMIYYFFEKRLDANNKPAMQRIERCNCYREVDGEKQYIPCFITNFKIGGLVRIYLFNYDKNAFEEIRVDEFMSLHKFGVAIPDEGKAKQIKKRYKSIMSCSEPNL